jgi:hypothetical protein
MFFAAVVVLSTMFVSALEKGFFNPLFMDLQSNSVQNYKSQQSFWIINPILARTTMQNFQIG